MAANLVSGPEGLAEGGGDLYRDLSATWAPILNNLWELICHHLRTLLLEVIDGNALRIQHEGVQQSDDQIL